MVDAVVMVKPVRPHSCTPSRTHLTLATAGPRSCLLVGLQPTDLFRGEGRNLLSAPGFASVTNIWSLCQN